MAKSNVDDLVVFEDSQGNEISNDPRWHALKRAESMGVDVSGNELAAAQDEIAQLKEQLAAANAKSDDIGEDDEKTDENGKRTYEELDGPALKALAKERSVDITGLKKVGEVRAALIAADNKE